MAFTENLQQFFETEDFAIGVTFVLASGATRQIKAIFDTPSQSVELYETAIEAGVPKLICATSETSGLERASTTINGVAYKIARIAHDGTGVSVLYLK
jgi:hypothetical protein